MEKRIGEKFPQILKNFQNWTKIEDLGYCISILEQHDWDFRSATLHVAAKEKRKRTNSGSNNREPGFLIRAAVVRDITTKRQRLDAVF